MSGDSILIYIIAFVIGWIIASMMGNGFSIGGQRGSDESGQGGGTHNYRYRLPKIKL